MIVTINYTCPRHGNYYEPAGHCPGCWATAKSLIKTLHEHAQAGHLSSFGDLPAVFNYLHILIAGTAVDPETHEDQTEPNKGDRLSGKGGAA
jgi:hypothetical protein